MKSFALGTSWESILVFIGLILVSAISNWVKQKRQGEKTAAPLPQNELPPPARTGRATPELSPPPSTTDAPKGIRWEEQLRRLFEEEEPPKTSPPALPRPTPTNKPPASPLIQAPAPGSPPPPQLRTPPALETTLPVHSTNRESISRDLQRARRVESRKSFEHARQLPGQIAERLQRVDAQMLRPMPSPPARLGMGEVEMIRILRHRHSARQAFVASLVFGPPKGLEFESDG